MSNLVHLKGLLDGVLLNVERSAYQGAPAYVEGGWAVDHIGCNCADWWSSKGQAALVDGKWRIHMSNKPKSADDSGLCCGWRRLETVAPTQLGDKTLAQWREDITKALYALKAAR